MPKPPFDHFRIIAPVYEKFLHYMDTEPVRKRLALPTSGWLLDAGGGTGRVAQGLRPYVDRVVVVDYSEGMLRQAARKEGIIAVRGQAESLPFADGAFARILVVDAFHHFHEQDRAVRELWRVLAPGGRLVIEEPNVDKFAVKLIAWGEKLLLMRSRFYRPAAIGQMFSALGADVEVDTTDALNGWVVVEKPR